MNQASYYSLFNIAALKNITVTLDDCLDRYYGLGELSNFCTVVSEPVATIVITFSNNQNTRSTEK